jgi:hypothetical protein
MVATKSDYYFSDAIFSASLKMANHFLSSYQPKMRPKQLFVITKSCTSSFIQNNIIFIQRAKGHLPWRKLARWCQWQRHLTATCDSHCLLVMATLGDTTQIGLFLFMLLCPRWPRQVSSNCCNCQHYCTNFCQWKHGFRIISICVTLPKVAKAIKTHRSLSQDHSIIADNFADTFMINIDDVKVA